MATTLGVCRSCSSPCAHRQKCEVGADADRSIYPREPRTGGPRAEWRRGSPRARSASIARPHRTPSKRRRRRGVCRRYIAGCVCEGRCEVPDVAALWRAPRAILARRGALRRYQRPALRQLPGRHLAVSRLGGEGVQRQHAFRSFHRRATRRRPVAQSHARPAHRHRLRAKQHHDERKRRHRRRSPRSVHQRPRRHRRHGVSRPDRRLRNAATITNSIRSCRRITTRSRPSSTTQPSASWI